MVRPLAMVNIVPCICTSTLVQFLACVPPLSYSSLHVYLHSHTVSCMCTSPLVHRVNNWLHCLSCLQKENSNLKSMEKSCANDGEHSENNKLNCVDCLTSSLLLHGLPLVL